MLVWALCMGHDCLKMYFCGKIYSLRMRSDSHVYHHVTLSVHDMSGVRSEIVTNVASIIRLHRRER